MRPPIARSPVLVRLRPAVCGAAALLLVGCVRSPTKPSAGGATRSEAPKPDEILFSHVTHVEQGVECATCHKGIDEAGRLGVRHSPTKETCADCHDVRETKGCGKCHKDPGRPSKLARSSSTPNLLFSHERHLKRATDAEARRKAGASKPGEVKEVKGGAECLTCHALAAAAATLGEVPRPRMRQDCFFCHNHMKNYRNLQCTLCHKDLTRAPIRFVSAFNHEGNFLKEHGRYGRANSDLCATCHGQSFCADCHSSRATVLPSVKHAERTDRSFIHRGDWISRHSLEARAEEGQCLRCHSPKSCGRCHQARGISAGSSTSTSGARRSPHPSDWLDPASPNGHGRDARRHIVQCASCHDCGALSNCVRCHKSSARGGLGLKPHPPGWKRGGRGTNPMCRYCH